MGYSCGGTLRFSKRLYTRQTIPHTEGFKPKGMHWRTFERLIAAQDMFAQVSILGMARWLDRHAIDHD
jgi:hypothetical protein